MRKENIVRYFSAFLATAMLILSIPIGPGLLQNSKESLGLEVTAEAAVTYYPKCNSNYTSIVDALNSIGVNSSYNNRKSIAQLNGISNYSGTASQNSTLLSLLKQGKLIKSKTNNVVSNPIPNGWYMIVSGNSDDRVLDINNWSQANGGNLETYQKNNTTNQRFYLQYSGGYYTIRAQHSGKYLHKANAGQTNDVHQWSGCGANQTLWAIESAGNGYYYIRSKCGNYLDNSNGSTKLGNNVITYPFNGSAAQKWKFVSTSTTNNEKKSVSNGWYMIQSGNSSDRVLDINNWSQDNGGNLETYKKNGTTNQIFYLEYHNDGYYTIKAKHSGKYLHKANSGHADNVHQWAGSGAMQTLWALEPAGNDYYYIRSKSGNYMDNANGSTNLGNNVITYWFNGSNAQKWKFVNPNSTVPTPKPEPSSSISYAPYTGIDYTKQTNSKSRISALKKGQQMVTIKWKSPVTFVTWCGKNGGYNSVTDANGNKPTTSFIKDRTYVGIPYSMKNHSYDDIAWSKFIKTNPSKNSLEASFYGSKKGTSKGMDCSYFVYLCWKAGGAQISYKNTSSMVSDKKTYVPINKKDMKPGDILLKDGHVMLFVGKSGKNYAVFEATASGSKTRYKVYTAKEISAYSARKYKNW